jgi:hypothetical protein
MAFPAGWAHRVALTIDHTNIDTDLTNWTLVFDQSFASVLTQVNGPLDADGTRPSINGGGDIRFSSDSAGSNQLPCDIRTWATNNNPGSATCEAAVRIGSVSVSNDTTIYMWWGKPGETQPAPNDTYGQYNAYDSNYVMVSPCSCATNRTSTPLTFTPVGTPTTGQAAKVGTGTLYNNPNNGGEYTEINESAPFNFDYDDAFTLEVIARKDSSENVPMMILAKIRENTVYEGYSLYYHDLSTVRELQWTMHPAAGSAQTANYPLTWDNGTWRHIAASYDGSNSPNGMVCFVNGVEPGSKTETNVDLSAGITHGDGFKIAARGWGAPNSMREWSGILDETRVSNVEREPAWLHANYYNQFNTPGFLTWSTITDISDDLTGADIAADVNIDTPTIGQVHGLTGTDIISVTAIDAPTLEAVAGVTPLTGVDLVALVTVDAPTIGQAHNLTTDDIAAVTTVDTPTLQSLVGVDSLTGVDLVAQTVVDAPTIGQDHQLTGADIAALTVIDTPTLQSVAGLDPLTGQDIAAGSAVSTPTIGQVHVIDGADLIGGVAVDAPVLGQVHVLTGTGITALSDISDPALIIGAVYEILELRASFTRVVELQAQFAGGNT